MGPWPQQNNAYLQALTKPLLSICHIFLCLAASCHAVMITSAEYRCSSSSHLNHRVRAGLMVRMVCATLCSLLCHWESLHSVNLFGYLLGLTLMTCPAQAHFVRRCAWTHGSTPASRTCCQAVLVHRFIQSSHASSGRRLGPAILRNISCCVVCRSLFS